MENPKILDEKFLASPATHRVTENSMYNHGKIEKASETSKVSKAGILLGFL
jgi:hypothetical protein